MNGVSPGPGGAFIEDRMAVTLGLGFQYRINTEWDLSYTRYYGAGRYNLLNDRDFATEFFIIGNLSATIGPVLAASARKTADPLCPRCRRHEPVNDAGLCGRCAEVIS